jgi:hypothetical protein
MKNPRAPGSIGEDAISGLGRGKNGVVDYLAHLGLFSRNARLYLFGSFLMGINFQVFLLLLNLLLKEIGLVEGDIGLVASSRAVGMSGLIASCRHVGYGNPRRHPVKPRQTETGVAGQLYPVCAVQLLHCQQSRTLPAVGVFGAERHGLFFLSRGCRSVLHA